MGILQIARNVILFPCHAWICYLLSDHKYGKKASLFICLPVFVRIVCYQLCADIYSDVPGRNMEKYVSLYHLCLIFSAFQYNTAGFYQSAHGRIRPAVYHRTNLIVWTGRIFA